MKPNTQESVSSEGLRARFAKPHKEIHSLCDIEYLGILPMSISFLEEMFVPNAILFECIRETRRALFLHEIMGIIH